MAQTKVSDLTALTSPDGSEELLVNDGGTSKKVTIDNLLYDEAIDSDHYVDGSIDNAHIADNAIDSEHYADASVDFAHIQNVAANSVLGRDANSSGVLSEVALATTEILIGDGTGFTAAALSGDVTMANTGAVTIGNDKIDSQHYAAGSIDNEHIADDAIDSEHYAAASIDAEHLAVDSVIGQAAIVDNSVIEGKLGISNAGTDGQYLQKQSSNTGGLTWATPTDTDTTYTAGTGITLSGTEFSAAPLALTTVQTAANQTAHLALTAQEGDIVVRSDENKTYCHNGGSAGTMADFTLLATPTDSVTSVVSQTGVVTATQILTALEDGIDSVHYKNGSIDNEHLADDAVGIDELSATGTAGATNFLRGDNSWVVPTDTNTNQLTTFTVSATTDTTPTTISQGDDLLFTAGTGITTETTADGTVTITNTVTDTTYSAGTSSTLGLIKLEDDTTQSVAANTVTTTSARTYGLQINGSGQGVINVPWTDSDTVYTHPTSAGNKHIPSGGAAGQILKYSSAGTAAWGADDAVAMAIALG